MQAREVEAKHLQKLGVACGERGNKKGADDYRLQREALLGQQGSDMDEDLESTLGTAIGSTVGLDDPSISGIS